MLPRLVAGVERDPDTGATFVVDDWQRLDIPSEPAPAGRMLSVVALAPRGRAADAVALQPDNGTLFMGLDEGQVLPIVDWTPSATAVPELLKRGLEYPIS